jgi:type I restriction enzyme S subunit
MRKDWEIKKLVDVCELITCGVAARPQYVDYGIPFLSAKNVKDGRIIWSGFNCVSKETHDELTKNNKPLKGDILYTRVGSYGEAAVIEDEKEFSVFVSLTLIKVKNDILFNYFLKYYLNSNEVKTLAKKSISSSGVGNLNVGTVRNFPISFPQLPEQKRIVSILDKTFAAIDKAKANAEQNLRNVKELFESYLQGVFNNGHDWQKLNLKDISIEFSRGKSKHRPRGDKSLLGGKYPLIQTGDIANSNHFLKTFNQSYNEKGLVQSKLWQKGTICIGIVGANVAETAILDFDACFPDSVIGIVVDESKAYNEYVEYLLQSFKAYLKEKGKGTARDNINMGTFQNEKFPFPDINEQTLIAEKLNQLSEDCRKLENIFCRKLNDLEELKNSILHKAFNGEL